MRKNLAKRAVFSVIAVALVSLVLWGLADAKPEATIVVLAYIGIITTTTIWFAMAWRLYDAKPKDALPALAICMTPYALTAGLGVYMVPYYDNGGGNMWAWILDSYGNIFFNGSFRMMASLTGTSISSAAFVALLLQIILPFALAYLFKLFNKKFRKNPVD